MSTYDNTERQLERLAREQCRIHELQQENERLSEQLADVKAAADRRMVTIAELEERCQDLAGQLELAKKSEDLIRKEYALLGAQMEIVYLIFGGRQGGECGGCH